MNNKHALKKGTLSSPQLYQYRTKDGQAYFGYSYHDLCSHFEVAIHQLPSFQGRDSSSAVAHWLPSPLSPINKKICFNPGFEPETFEQAQKFSMDYSEIIWKYIKTGETPDSQISRRR